MHVSVYRICMDVFFCMPPCAAPVIVMWSGVSTRTRVVLHACAVFQARHVEYVDPVAGGVFCYTCMECFITLSPCVLLHVCGVFLQARHVEYVDPVEAEWEKFQREMQTEMAESEVILDEDQQEATVGRQIEEVDEQKTVLKGRKL